MEDIKIEEQLNNEINMLTPDVLNKVKNRIRYSSEPAYRKKRFFNYYKKPLIASFACFILIFVFLLNVVIYNQEYQTITIDVNPSVELSLNRYDYVIGVNYNNEDAYNSFNELELVNKKADKAIETCYNKLVEDGYLNDEDNIVVISAYSSKHEVKEEKVEKYTDSIKKASSSKGKECDVYDYKVSEEHHDEAKENNISYGKLEVIKDIMQYDSTYKMEDLKNYSMKDLKHLLKELKEENKHHK